MGLLKTAARAAVVTSVATRTHARVAAKQEARWAQQTAAPGAAAPLAPAPPAAPPAPPAAPPPPPPPAPVLDTQTLIDQLRQLGELRDAGVLTEAEFEVKKAQLLR